MMMRNEPEAEMHPKWGEGDHYVGSGEWCDQECIRRLEPACSLSLIQLS